MDDNGHQERDETPIRLTPEQIEMVRLAQVDFEHGEETFTPEQVLKRARARLRATPGSDVS